MSNYEIECKTKYVVAGRDFDAKFDAELYRQAARIADAAEELNELFSEGKLQDICKALYRLDVGTCEHLVNLANVISAAARELLDMRRFELDMRRFESASVVAVDERGES